MSSTSSSDSTKGGSGCNEANVELNEIFEGSNLLKKGNCFSGEAVKGFKSDNSWLIEEATEAVTPEAGWFDEFANDGKMGMGKWRPLTDVVGGIGCC